MNTDVALKKKKHRSPNHPAFSLPVAIEKSQMVYDNEKTNMVSPQAAIVAMGMKPTGSSGQRALSTLIQFGLLDDAGSRTNRRVGLSEIARTILLRMGDSDPQRLAAIKESALKPVIHQAFKVKYPDSIPSDTELHNFLVEKGFNPDSTQHLIGEWRETFSFACLENDAILKEEEITPPGDDIPPPLLDPARSLGKGTNPKGFSMGIPAESRTIAVPISGGRTVLIEAPVEFSQGDYDMFKAVLDAMAPGIIYEPPVEPQPEQNEN